MSQTPEHAFSSTFADILDKFRARDYLLFDLDAILEHILQVVPTSQQRIPFVTVVHILERIISWIKERDVVCGVVCFAAKPLLTAAQATSTAWYSLAKTICWRHLEKLKSIHLQLFLCDHFASENAALLMKQIKPALFVVPTSCVIQQQYSAAKFQIPIAHDFEFEDGLLNAFVVQVKGTRSEKEQVSEYFCSKVNDMEMFNSVALKEASKHENGVLAALVKMVNQENIYLCSLAWLTHILQQSVTLEARAQKTTGLAAANAFLDDFYKHLLVAETDFEADLFDGNLFTKLYSMYQDKAFVKNLATTASFELPVDLPAPQLALYKKGIVELCCHPSTMFTGFPETSELKPQKYQPLQTTNIKVIHNTMLAEYFENETSMQVLTGTPKLSKLEAWNKHYHSDYNLTEEREHKNNESDFEIAQRSRYMECMNVKPIQYPATNVKIEAMKQSINKYFEDLPKLKIKKRTSYENANQALHKLLSAISNINQHEINFNQSSSAWKSDEQKRMIEQCKTLFVKEVLDTMLYMLLLKITDAIRFSDASTLAFCFDVQNFMIKSQLSAKPLSKPDTSQLLNVPSSFTYQEALVALLINTRMHDFAVKVLGVSDIAMVVHDPIEEIQLGQSEVTVNITNVVFPEKYIHKAGVEEIVLDFKPDDWQNEVLQIIDHNVEQPDSLNLKSLLISAPTSAGKTFITFYACRRVLDLKKQNIIVYVLPTNSLVNQVYYELCCLFSKRVTSVDCPTVGMATKKTRINESNCNVLVTNPAMFEIFLLNPNFEEWKSNIKLVILDEIHNMFASNGNVWEHTLYLLKCPFIALSATLGNPVAFQQALQQIVSAQNTNMTVELIPRPVNSQVIPIPRMQPLSYEMHHPITGEIIQFHPLSFLASADTVSTHEWNVLPAFTVEHMKDTLQLLEILKSRGHDISLFDKVNILDAQTLQTRLFVAHKLNDANLLQLRLEFKAKLELCYLQNKSLFADIASYYIAKYETKMAEIENIVQLDAYTMRKKYSVPLVLSLQKNKKLPVIIFLLSKKLIDEVACQLLAYCYIHSTTFFADGVPYDMPWKDEKQSCNESSIKVVWSAKGENIKAIEANLILLGLTSITFFKDSTGIEVICPKSQAPALLDLEEKYPNHEFFATVAFVDGMENEYLKHGFGVHHNSVNDNYIREVEILFRKRKLPIVFATGTLAFGINMPCRSTVIYGDSQYMNSALFHQMVGRSGRRGYEKKGTALLFGLHSTQIKRLVMAPMPNMSSSKGLCVSFVLRLLALYTCSKNCDAVHEDVKLALSQMLGKQPGYKQILKWNVRFALEFLVVNKFMDQRVNLHEYAILVARAPYLEPHMYLLTKFLQEDLLNDISEEQLVHVLSFLFAKFAPKNAKQGVFQNPLPNILRVTCTNYNREVNLMLRNFMTSATTEMKIDSTSKLPLYGQVIGASQHLYECKITNDLQASSFANQCCITSPFALICGIDDRTSDSPSTWAYHIKDGLLFDMSMLPILSNVSAPINSYFADFLKHGNLQQLVTENGFLNEYDADNALNDFYQEVKKIFQALYQTRICHTFKRKLKAIKQKYEKLTRENDYEEQEEDDEEQGLLHAQLAMLHAHEAPDDDVDKYYLEQAEAQEQFYNEYDDVYEKKKKKKQDDFLSKEDLHE